MKHIAVLIFLFPLLLCAELPPSLDEQLFGLAGGSNYVVWCKSEGYQEFSRKVFVFLGAEFSCVNSAGDTSGDKLLYRIMMLKDNLENGVSGSGVRQTIEEVRSWIVSKFPNPSFPTVNQLLDGRIGFSAENVDGQGWNVECYAIRSNGCWRVVCDCVNDLHKQGKSVSCEVMRSSEDGFDPGATKDFRPYFSRLCESDSVRRDGVLRVLFEQIGDGDYEVWRKNGCKFMPGKFLEPFTNTVVTTVSTAEGQSAVATSVRMEANIEFDDFEEAISIAKSLHFMLGRRIPKANFSIEEKKGCSYVVNYPCADRFGWTLRISAERMHRSNKVVFTLEFDGRSARSPVFAVCQSNDTVEAVQEGETIIRGDPSSVDSVLALLDMPELEIVRGNVSTGVVYALKTELFPFRKCMLREFAKKDRLPYAYCSSGFGWQIQELCSSNVVEGMSFGQAEFKLAEVRDYLVDALKGRAIRTGVAKNEYSILSQEKTIGHWEVNLSFTRQGDDKVLFTLRIFREPYVSPVKPKTDASDQIEVEI